MPDKWTGEIVGELHVRGITAKQLADELGWHPKYLSSVLNGRKHPGGAEDKVKSAMARLVSRQESTM